MATNHLGNWKPCITLWNVNYTGGFTVISFFFFSSFLKPKEYFKGNPSQICKQQVNALSFFAKFPFPYISHSRKLLKYIQIFKRGLEFSRSSIAKQQIKIIAKLVIHLPIQRGLLMRMSSLVMSNFSICSCCCTQEVQRLGRGSRSPPAPGRGRPREQILWSGTRFAGFYYSNRLKNTLGSCPLTKDPQYFPCFNEPAFLGEKNNTKDQLQMS